MLLLLIITDFLLYFLLKMSDIARFVFITSLSLLLTELKLFHVHEIVYEIQSFISQSCQKLPPLHFYSMDSSLIPYITYYPLSNKCRIIKLFNIIKIITYLLKINYYYFLKYDNFFESCWSCCMARLSLNSWDSFHISFQSKSWDSRHQASAPIPTFWIHF